MRKISIDKLNDLFALVSSSETLYIPVDTESGAKYEKWEDGKKLSDALNTVRSAKDFFFPQTENLMDFKVEGKNIEIIDTRNECEDFVIFGVRACDVKSFEVLDRVFLAEPVDSYYKNRRDHATVVSMACNKPAETCFCKTFGIDASDPEGDVVCYKTDDSILFDAKTDKGEKFLETVSGITEDAAKTAADEQKELICERLSKLPLAGLDASAFGSGKTKEFFDAPEWGELSESCLGCGTCTFVCPTCQCYDIKDFNTGHGVKRFRCWDSCMYSDFTKMSAGQPRLTQLERFRQRFMHKLVYYPTNNDGLFSCVGCGRCMAKCPIQMNIVKVMKKLGGRAND
ncbi:MAG: 4Fe-4S dicluster domain-containing protein [Clostridia bacterium]|nr:4Fe-4S dicluster domain-containing protein [Clostridia bacterium]